MRCSSLSASSPRERREAGAAVLVAVHRRRRGHLVERHVGPTPLVLAQAREVEVAQDGEQPSAQVAVGPTQVPAPDGALRQSWTRSSAASPSRTSP